MLETLSKMIKKQEFVKTGNQNALDGKSIVYFVYGNVILYIYEYYISDVFRELKKYREIINVIHSPVLINIYVFFIHMPIVCIFKLFIVINII